MRWLPRSALALIALLPALAQAGAEAGCGIACDSDVWVAVVQSVGSGPWQTEARMRQRELNVQLRIERVLKGPALQGLVRASAVQFEPAGSRNLAVLGVWSGLELRPQTRWVLFLRGPHRSSPRELPEDEVRLVLPAVEAAADAAFVVAAMQRRLGLAQMVGKLPGPELNFGPVLADELLARAEPALATEPAGFAALARLLAQPTLPAAFRRQVYGGLVDALARREFAPDALAAELALTGLLLLAAPDATALAPTLRQNWLPALLGLGRGAARISPTTVFAKAPAERARVAAVSDLGPALRDWLEERRP